MRVTSHSLQRAVHVQSYRDENIRELGMLAGGEIGTGKRTGRKDEAGIVGGVQS